MIKSSSNQYSIQRNRQVIFMESLIELIVRQKLRTPYNLVRQSAILRLLLIDGGKLYSEINRPFKFKLGAKISSGTNSGNSISSADTNRSAFEMYFHKTSKNGEFIGLESFLSLPAIRTNNQDIKKYCDINHIKENYSIREIIKLVANAHGGVHFEKWNNIPPQLMTDPISPFNINDNSKLHDIVLYVSIFVAEALKPLADHVYIELKRTKPTSVEATAIFDLKERQ